jgi:hypothetical protein
MHKEDAKISCQVFQKQEAVIKDITSKINAIEGVVGKAVFAEILQKELDVLFSCQDHKDASLDCENCNFIAALRKKTADIIVKAKKLG